MPKKTPNENFVTSRTKTDLVLMEGILHPGLGPHTIHCILRGFELKIRVVAA
jgi:hypothetical protein